ncbi:MAG: glycosyltransferase family 39 protein [Ferruginibacter sp.]|nr:glycosyltransferase family 39 protein [Cytophagales bacterium]
MTTRLKYSLLFGLLGALFFVPFLGGVHLFDWDEINFAECTREMVIMRDYLRVYINFEPFWEKPPFFFWMQALAMHAFGINEFAARLPNAACGIVTLILLFNIGNRLYDARFGLLWAGAYLGSILPHLYFRSGIIDPYFNLFIFLGLYLFILFYWKKDGFSGIRLARGKYVYLVAGGLVVGMGILTKGPVAYLIVCLTLFVYWVRQRFRFYVSVPQFGLFSLAASVVTLTWYGIETAVHGPWFVTEFTKYQYRLFSTPDAGHAGFPGYHFVVLLVGCFPASIFALRGFLGTGQTHVYQRDFKAWMVILFWVVLILFTVVKSKIVHYSSMCYFPLTYLAALTVYQLLNGKVIFARWMKAGLFLIASVWSLATIALPFVAQRIDLLRPLLSKDPFAVANLDARVNWTGWEAMAGVVLITATWLGIRRMGGASPDPNRQAQGIGLLFGGTAVFVLLTLTFFIARIEGYSQGSAIRFYERLQGKDVYAEPFGFRTYGHLFYTRKQPNQTLRPRDQERLLRGPLNKDLYLVAKITAAAPLRADSAFRELGSENGFVFFVRRKKE